MTRANIQGCILGTAIGDALGLPYEGLSPRRATRLLGPPDRYRLLFRYGMFSDDTEHTCIVVQALIAAGNDVHIFRNQLACSFRWWMLALPAGIGLATLRAIIKLWLGFGTEHSGVFSAGNGPAMRAGILGAAIDDAGTLRQFVRASTRITHTDPKAEFAAFAIALATQMSRQNEVVFARDYVNRLASLLGELARELLDVLTLMVDSVESQQATVDFARSIGLGKGVTGYSYHSVPVALHAWLSHRYDYRAAVISAIECGGDTDTVAAMTGAIVGATVGMKGIPDAWKTHLADWPRTIGWMEKLGVQLDEVILSGKTRRPLSLFFPGIMMRNILFMMLVLFHGFRRLLPPY